MRIRFLFTVLLLTTLNLCNLAYAAGNLPAVNTDMGCTVPGQPIGYDGSTYITCLQAPSAFTAGTPFGRTFNLATAYQCSVTTKPCLMTITLSAQSAVSLSGATNNEGAITIGATNGVASGTGTNLATYRNNLGGTLVVGLNITSAQASTNTVLVPIGWYLAIRQTTGTGLSVVSTYEQTVN